MTSGQLRVIAHDLPDAWGARGRILPRDDPRRAVGVGLDGLARMDSRIHMRLSHGDQRWGEDLERRLGGRLAIDYEPMIVHY